MTQRFLVIIGTGTAASGVASRCRNAGWSVAIVDERPFGGTCALRGCDPKKVLRRAAEVVDAARLMNGRGIAGPAPKVEWPALMAFKRSFTDPVPNAREKAFADTFGIARGVPLLIAGAATGAAMRLRGVTAWVPRIERAGGALLLLVAAYFLYQSAAATGMVPPLEFLLADLA